MKIAVFTIVRNEETFLPMWLKHYSKVADYILVLDNDTEDGSTDNIGVDVIKVSCGEAFNHDWLKATVMSHQKRLLEKFDWVIFAEVDEFIVHTKLSLRKAIEGLKVPFVRCDGFNIVQLKDEPPLDWNKPLLPQRSSWSWSYNMCKTLISSIPLKYSVGFHKQDKQGEPNKDFVLLHLHNIDYDYSFENSKKRAKYPWAKKDIIGRLAWHNRITNKEQFDSWYYSLKPTPYDKGIVKRCDL